MTQRPNPTPALLDRVMHHLPHLRAQGVKRAEIGGIVIEFGAPGDAGLTDTTSGATVPEGGQLALPLASAAPAAQPEATAPPAAPAVRTAEHAAEDDPDDLDLGHLR
jgi:hypothetical protein